MPSLHVVSPVLARKGKDEGDTRRATSAATVTTTAAAAAAATSTAAAAVAKVATAATKISTRGRSRTSRRQAAEEER